MELVRGQNTLMIDFYSYMRNTAAWWMMIAHGPFVLKISAISVKLYKDQHRSLVVVKSVYK